MNIIGIDNFSLKIKDKVLFDNVSLKIKEHSWLVLTGNIGSGKSTLLRTICKLYKDKYEGVITYKEKNIADIPMQEHVKNIGYVMQHAINQFVMPTLEEEIIFSLENLCLDSQAINEKLEYALAITKTKDLAHKHIHTLSGGERQRAAFAVALAMGSEILILDEPFANVDKKTRNSLLTLLKDLNNHGVTIIVCDHEYQLYLNYADTFYYLSDGRLELIENPSIKNTTINLAKNIQTEELLKLEDVIIFQGNKELLNTTDFTIHKGITTLTGDNGTGKTTLSTDPNRKLIGDDEHGWSDHGIFNFEGGCYAKCINLKEKYEPEIYHAIKFGSLVENVVMDPKTQEFDFKDKSLTENTRVGYPINYISNAQIPGVGGIPSVVIFLTADAFGTCFV